MKLAAIIVGLLGMACLAFGAPETGQKAQDSNIQRQGEIKALIDLVDVKIWTDYRESRHLAEKAMKELAEHPNDSLKARLLNLMAYGKILANDTQGAYRDLSEARTLATKVQNIREEAESFRHEGNVMVVAGAYGEGLALYIKALKLHEKIKSDMVFDTLQGMSLPYLYTGDYKKYLEYGYKLLARPEAQGVNRDKGLALYTIGHALIQLKRYKEAKPYIEQSIDIFRSLNASYTSEMYTALAELEFREGNYQNTLTIIDKSLAWSAQSGYRIAEYLNHILRAKTLVKLGHADDAIVEMNRLQSHSELKEAQMGAWEELAKIYQSRGEYHRAYDAFKKFKELADSIYNDKNAARMDLLKTKFDTEQKERQIRKLRNEAKLQALQAKRVEERSRLLSYIVALVTLIVVILVFIIRHYIKVRAQLTRSAKQLQEANQAKSEFLANMSHEIRTPMNAILGMTRLALSTSLSVQQQDYLGKINSSGRHLLQVINDILDFSKIEAGKLDIERLVFSFDEVLQNVSNVVAELAEQKNIELIFSMAENLPARLYGDPLRLGQVLINLCSNAVKFTHQGEVIVSCSYTTDSDGSHTINISVKDTGIGLSKEQQQKLFKSFSQADTSTTRRFGGTGLGLAISRQLVNMMGGDIHVESELGKGSTFSFSIPIDNADESAPAPEIPEVLKDLNVLVVDDNENARLLMKTLLEDLGFRVSLAEDGEQSLKIVEKAQESGELFDLILMDWRMPGMNGFETAKALNRRRRGEAIPAVLMVTSYGRDEVMKMDRDKVLSGFIMKPVTAPALLDAIRRTLGHFQQPGSRELLAQRQQELRQSQDQSLIDKVKRISGARILLVEDNELNQQVASELLQQAGMKVEFACNGKEALEMARNKGRYDLIFMDIQMPLMDGYEATRALRAFDELSDLPIVAMTAHAMQGERERCEQAGMDDYLTKPLEPDELHKMLIRWIKQADRPSQEVTIKTDNSHQLDIATREGTVSLPTVMDGIDVRLGLKRTGNKPKLYIELANTFLKQYKNAGQQFKTMIIERDFDGIHRLAHIMQAGAGSIGAEKLRKDLVKIVELSDQQVLSSQHMFDFYREMNKVFDSIGKLPSLEQLAEQKPTATKRERGSEVTKEQIAPVIMQLLQSLEEGAFDAKDQLTELVELLGGNHSELTDKLTELVNDYEFIQARELLEQLARRLGYAEGTS